MTRDEFLRRLKAEREAWEKLLGQVPREHMEEPGVAGAWSVKDLIAHITWHEKEMCDLLDTRQLIGSPWWLLPTDERNANIHEANRDRPLDDVLDEAVTHYPIILEAVMILTDEEFADPATFADMPLDWLPGDILAQNTYLHYADHATALRRWLAELSEESSEQEDH